MTKPPNARTYLPNAIVPNECAVASDAAGLHSLFVLFVSLLCVASSEHANTIPEYFPRVCLLCVCVVCCLRRSDFVGNSHVRFMCDVRALRYVSSVDVDLCGVRVVALLEFSANIFVV